MKKYSSLMYASLLLVVGLTQPFTAYADTLQIIPPANVISNIPGLIGWAIQILFIVAGLVAFVYLLLGGIKWITSGGDKGQVEAARSQIIQALIGLIIVFASWGIIVLVERMTGIGLGFGKAVALPGSDLLRESRQVCLDNCNNITNATDRAICTAGCPAN